MILKGSCRVKNKYATMENKIVEKIAPEFAGLLVKIGAIIIIVLGIFEIIKGIVIILFASAIGALLSSLLPVYGEILKLIPVGGMLLALLYIVIGSIVVSVGFSLLKASLPLTPDQRNRWITLLGVLIAIALLFSSWDLLIGLVLALAGIIILPVAQAPPTPTGKIPPPQVPPV